MSDLSPDARALLARVSSSDGPTRKDRDRVLAAVSGALLPAAGAAATATAVASAGTAKLVVAFVISIGVGALVTTAGTSVLVRGSKPPPPVVLVAPPPVAPKPRIAALVVAPPPSEPEPLSTTELPRLETQRPGLLPRQAPPPPVAEIVAPLPEVPPPSPVARPDDACELSAELAVIQQAQQALKTNPRQAIAALDSFAARCASGALLEERLATRALALCTDGKKDDGRATAQELRERFPSSPSLERVAQACRP